MWYRIGSLTAILRPITTMTNGKIDKKVVYLKALIEQAIHLFEFETGAKVLGIKLIPDQDVPSIIKAKIEYKILE